MTWRVQKRVWESDLPREEKYILLGYANWGEDDGTRVFPSQKRVAWLTKSSEKTVSENTKLLIKRKVLVLVRRKGRRTTKGYWIDFKALPSRPAWTWEETTVLESRPEETAGLDLTPENGAATVKTGSFVDQDQNFFPQDQKFSPSRPEETSANPKSEPFRKNLEEKPQKTRARESMPYAKVIDLSRDSVKEAQAKKELGKYRTEIFKTRLYADDELSELKTKTLDELRVLHAERLSKAQVSQRDGISRVIPADRKYEGL